MSRVCVATLFKEVKEGHTDSVGKMLVENSDIVTAIDEKGQTPLHLACLNNDSSMVALLLSKNADYELKNHLGQTSFDIARDLGYFDIIKLFLKDNQKCVVPSELAHLLRIAVTNSDLELLNLILEKNMDACLEKNENGDSILHFSVEKNSLDATKILVHGGVKVDIMNNNGQIPLHIASKLKFYLLARFLLHTDPNTVNSQDSAGNTALHFAAQNGSQALIRELITEGARTDLANCDGLTPLHITIQFRCLEAFYELLDFNADVNVKNKEGNTPLHFCVFNGNFDMTKKLVLKCADVNCQNNYGQTPLHITCEQNSIDLTLFLLSQPLFNSQNVQDCNGNTLLHCAALRDNYLLIEELVNRGATLDVTNCNGHTPLHIAILGDCLQAFDRLICLGANVNIKDIEGVTALHISVARGVLSAVRRLIFEGADLEVRDNYGYSPVHYAANCQSYEILKYLYYLGSENVTNYCQQTLVHVAVLSCPNLGISDKECRKCWDVFDFILSFMGVNVSAQDFWGGTALHYAAQNGCIPLFNYLREQNSTKLYELLEVQNENGQTVLHVAALNNWTVFDQLLGDNANPDSKDLSGVTPFELLSQNYEQMEHIEEEHGGIVTLPVKPMIFYFISLTLHNIIDLLLKRNSSIETKYNGNTVLIYTVERGLEKGTQFLLERGADVNAKNDDGYTALHIAVMKSHLAKSYVSIAHYLILGGADVNVKSRDGKTPLHFALEKERVHTFVLSILLDNGAIVDVVDSERKTPLDYISPENLENPLINNSLKYYLTKLKTVNMLSRPIELNFHQHGFKEFQEGCLKEIEIAKAEKCGRNSLYDVFFQYKNPTYIFNKILEKRLKKFKMKEDQIYPIYGTLFKQTFKRAKDRYRSLQDAQQFFTLLGMSFQQRLPDEIRRMILVHLCDNDLETLIKISKDV